MKGALRAHTPNIDKLAKQGTLFTNAHCQAPISGPSRACIMTGMYPSTTGNYLQVNDVNIKKSNEKVGKAIFMADFFEGYGYKTMAVGKIFHNGDGAESFDEYGGRFDWFGPKPAERINYDPAVRPGKSGSTQTDWGAYPEHDSLMTDFKVADWAVNKLGEDFDKPFFLAVGFLRPHVPWYVPQKWYDMFPKEKIKMPPYLPDDFNDIPDFAKIVAEAPMMPSTEELIKSNEWKDVVQAYLACVAFVDEQIGKVLNALDNSKYASNTIVVLWADHGYHLGEKNRFAKQALWERDTRTVLIFRQRNDKGGKECNAPVQLVDIYPTLVELCSLPPYEQADGHSLADLLKNPGKKWDHPALSFYGVGNVVVRDERYRLTRYEDGSMELYDMVIDPNEWKNLAYDPREKTRIENMAKHIPYRWAPLSRYSNYDFNEYFKAKSEESRKGL